MTLAGALPALFTFLFTNWLMFGSPLVTSYDRWRHWVNGQLVVSSQRENLACSIIDGLSKAILQPQSGLLIGAPLILVALAFGARHFWNKARNEMILCAVSCAGLLLLFSGYCLSFPGSFGNRYLMPIVALMAIPLGMALEDCFFPLRSANEERGGISG